MGGTKQTALHLICAVAGSCVEGTLEQHSQEAGRSLRAGIQAGNRESNRRETALFR